MPGGDAAAPAPDGSAEDPAVCTGGAHALAWPGDGVSRSEGAEELGVGRAVEAVGEDAGVGDDVASSGWSGGVPTRGNGVLGPAVALSRGAALSPGAESEEIGSSSGSEAWESGLAGECSPESFLKCMRSAFSGCSSEGGCSSVETPFGVEFAPECMFSCGASNREVVTGTIVGI
jgi:hypothetical protein